MRRSRDAHRPPRFRPVSGGRSVWCGAADTPQTRLGSVRAVRGAVVRGVLLVGTLLLAACGGRAGSVAVRDGGSVADPPTSTAPSTTVPPSTTPAAPSATDQPAAPREMPPGERRVPRLGGVDDLFPALGSPDVDVLSYVVGRFRARRRTSAARRPHGRSARRRTAASEDRPRARLPRGPVDPLRWRSDSRAFRRTARARGPRADPQRRRGRRGRATRRNRQTPSGPRSSLSQVGACVPTLEAHEPPDLLLEAGRIDARPLHNARRRFGIE